MIKLVDSAWYVLSGVSKALGSDPTYPSMSKDAVVYFGSNLEKHGERA